MHNARHNAEITNAQMLNYDKRASYNFYASRLLNINLLLVPSTLVTRADNE